jgi:hypothetical protein
MLCSALKAGRRAASGISEAMSAKRSKTVVGGFEK